MACERLAFGTVVVATVTLVQPCDHAAVVHAMYCLWLCVGVVFVRVHRTVCVSAADVCIKPSSLLNDNHHLGIPYTHILCWTSSTLIKVCV